MFDEIRWDEDALDYGYVVTRLPSGEWWHMHFGRSTLTYDCELLARKSNILASIQLLGVGAVIQSPRFILTLDAEGVEIPTAELDLKFGWQKSANSADVSADAQHFQREIMPLIYDSERFQSAVQHIVDKRSHRRLFRAVG